MRPVARLLSDGRRLHLQYGPSDLIVMAEGDRQRAFGAAVARFETIIAEVVEELPVLRAELSQDTKRPLGVVARRMHDAALPFAADGFLTRMAAVAGAIADEVLAAMIGAANLRRAYVNNGGDIALYLAPGTRFRTAIKAHNNAGLGEIDLCAEESVRGIATSGRHGRSLSLGIADSVTVLAGSAARADVAATLVANAVDLPGHKAVTRRPAKDIVDDSDLGARLVTLDCSTVSDADCAKALARGRARADSYCAAGLISCAGLFLQGQAITTSKKLIQINQEAIHA